jgi:hypothetical protein
LGHVSGSIESVKPQALLGLTNLAPYASVTASSYRDTGDPDYQPFVPAKINDRRGWVPAPTGGPAGAFGEGAFQDGELGWMAAEGQSVGEWVELTWPTPMLASQVRLVGPSPIGGDWSGFGDYWMGPSPYHVTAGTLRLYRDGVEVSTISVGQVEPFTTTTTGTLITLPVPIQIDRLTFTVDAISGKWYSEDVAALNEIEVIGQAVE